MARPRKPARLWLDPTERIWIILDGGRQIRIGCGEAQRHEAENSFQSYLAEKHKPRQRVSDLAALPIAEVLNAYATEHAINLKSAAAIGNDLMPLIDFFGERTLAEVNKNLCNAYMAFRRKQGIKLGNRTVDTSRSVSDGTLRRELAILSASIGHWHENHGPLNAVPVVSLPPKPPARPKALDRSEAALFLASCLGFYQDEAGRWKRDRNRINKGAARFLLLGLATGSRPGVTLSVQWMPNLVAGWINLDKALIYRAPEREVQTKKRKPPAALGDRIMSHLRRWHRIDMEARAALPESERSGRFVTVVHFKGMPIGSNKKSFKTVRERAGLGGDVLRHTLRHTKATWAMQAGVDLWEAAGALGMSVKTLEETYGHHNPNFQQNVKQV